LGPEAPKGQLPDSLLGVIKEVFDAVTDQQLGDPEFATVIAREVANKVLRSIERAKSSSDSKSAAVRNGFQRLGLKGNPEDFIR